MEGIVATKDGKIVARERGRGISPALKLYRAGLLSGAAVADKIVGRAASAIFIAGGVVSVRADVMSVGAAQFLSAHGIPAEADVVTPQIINRRGTGPCPMEAAVEGMSDPREMVSAIERKLAEMEAERGNAT